MSLSPSRVVFRGTTCLMRLLRPGPFWEVEVEPGRPEHVLADLLVLVRAAARYSEAAHDGTVPLEGVAALGSDDRVLAHPADLGEEDRVGVPPAFEHVGGPLHDGRRIGLGQ